MIDAPKSVVDGFFEKHLRLWQPKMYMDLETPILNRLMGEDTWKFREHWDPIMRNWLGGKPVGA